MLPALRPGTRLPLGAAGIGMERAGLGAGVRAMFGPALAMLLLAARACTRPMLLIVLPW